MLHLRHCYGITRTPCFCSQELLGVLVAIKCTSQTREHKNNLQKHFLFLLLNSAAHTKPHHFPSFHVQNFLAHHLRELSPLRLWQLLTWLRLRYRPMAHNPEEPCAKHPPWGCQRASGDISNQFCSHPMAACSLPAYLPRVRVRGSRAAVSKPYQSHSGKMLVTGNINPVLLQLTIANFSFLMLFSCLHGLSIIPFPRSTNKDKVRLWSAPACW